MPDPVPYDLAELFRMLDEVQGYFAELRHIDTAMLYMRNEEANWFQKGDSGGVVTSGTAYVEVEFGRTFPFTKRYQVPNDWYDSPFGLFDDTKKERVEARLEELAAEATGWAATEMESVKESIKPFVWPSGSRYEYACLAPVADLHEELEDEVSNDFGRLKHTLADWKGDAADNFASYFYFPFEHTLRSQKQMLTALMAGITSSKAIAESTQHSIMNVVNATRAALREQLELAQATAELERRQSQMKALILIGSGATVFSGLLGAAAASGVAGLWAAGFSTVAGATGLASATIPEDASTDFGIEGSTAVELRDALADAIAQVKRNDGKQHEALHEEVRAVLSRVRELRGGADGEDGRLIPIRPDIVNGVDADDFYLP